MRSVQRTLSLRGINRGPRGILCTRGEKAHTSKRVSIAAPTMRFQKRSVRRIARKGILFINPTQDAFVLAWEKGAHKQKSEQYRLQ